MMMMIEVSLKVMTNWLIVAGSLSLPLSLPPDMIGGSKQKDELSGRKRPHDVT